MKQEIWKDIPEYERLYQASNLGKIRTHKNKTTFTKKHGVRHWKQRILKPKISKNGTHRVHLWKNGTYKTLLLYRLVGITFIPNPYNLATINHKNGNRYDNSIDNLEWMSLIDNVKHGWETGLIHNNIPIKTINKITGEIVKHFSMVKAGKYMGHSYTYVHSKIKKGIYENKNYRWELV